MSRAPRFTACADCLFWLRDEARDGVGFCHRRAPVPAQQFVGRFAEVAAIWPGTLAEQGCGDGQPAPRERDDATEARG
jgi:hypothetical protein